MTEEWRPAPEWEGRYFVSNLGNVKSASGRIRKLCRDEEGYLKVTLYKPNVTKTIKVHRLVAIAFLGRSHLMVNHINGIKDDNRVENLEYVSNRENRNHFHIANKTHFMRGVQRYRDDNGQHYGRYRAQTSVKGKQTHLGTFDTELEAHQAYLAAVKEIGETKYAGIE